MCEFFSCILKKDGTVLWNNKKGELFIDDSHEKIIEEYKLDANKDETKTYIRVEITPKDDDIYNHKKGNWEIEIDEDTTPDWYTRNIPKYEKQLMGALTTCFKKCFLINKKNVTLTQGIYFIKDSEITRIYGNTVIRRLQGSSTVQEMWGLSTVQVMGDSSTVQEMRGSSTVQVMEDSSTVQVMWGSSTVQVMWDSSTVQEMRGSSTVQVMRGSSTVQEMWGSSTVQEMLDSSTVQVMWGSSTVQEMLDSSTVQRMEGSSVCINRGTKEIRMASTNKKTWKLIFKTGKKRKG